MAVTYDAPPRPADIQAGAANEANWYSTSGDMLAGRMPNAVKGAGYIQPGGVTPLDGQKDSDQIFERSFNAVTALRRATHDGIHEGDKVQKGLSPAFLNEFPSFLPGIAGSQMGGQGLQQLVGDLNNALKGVPGIDKNFTLTAPLATGFVPFDLVAP